jgi:hypothetical protein
MTLMEPEGGEVAPHTHTIEVDGSLTPLEAWTELSNFGQRVTFTGSTTHAEVTGCDGIQCRNIGVGSLV